MKNGVNQDEKEEDSDENYQDSDDYEEEFDFETIHERLVNDFDDFDN